ncbi:hypothetical protein SSX86_022774 [Deinandra increscens subsp. villosa]|uniref:Non-specific lipid-transfer protein n=1 Tax=Deinandra increscens subsp. villosa TaxID=3103831 RepID=A0AAP0CPK6_9ASTR
MVRIILPMCLISIIMVSLANQHVKAQVNCGEVIFKLLSCESFLFGYSSHPNAECCASARDLVQAANASRDVRRATCHCLKNAVQSIPVNLTNAANLTSLCHLSLDIPISPSVDCDSL